MPVSLLPAISALQWIRKSRGFIVFHPKHGSAVRAAGLTTADAILDLPGEVLSGHAHRHVVAVRVGRMRCILKREHRVSLGTRCRNFLAGFRASSLAHREALALDALSHAGVPVSQWLAYGESRGRAFVLLRRDRGADLRSVLQPERLSERQRQSLAGNIGRAVASILRAGFTAPDLSAKHVFVRRDRSVVLLDWPRARRSPTVTVRTIAEVLAGLHASLRPDLASPRERLLVLRICLRKLGFGTSLGTVAKMVIDRSAHFARSRSIREQLQSPDQCVSQRIRWIAGERLCVTRPFWQMMRGKLPEWLIAAAHQSTQQSKMNRVALPRYRHGWFLEYPSTPNAWWRRWLRKPIRARSVAQAGLIFRLQRYGVPISRVLAFGGREDGSGFLLTHANETTRSLRTWLALPRPGRRTALRRTGRLLRRCHEAGCLGVRGDSLSVQEIPRVRILLSADGQLRACSRLTPRQASDEVRALAFALGLDRRRDVVRLLHGYFANLPLRHQHLQLASNVLEMSRRAA